MKMIQYPRRSLMALLLALVTLVACGPYRLVSEYDQVMDAGVSDFHTKVSAFVGKMTAIAGKPEGTYEVNKGYYPELSGAVSTLRMRAAQTPNNDITIKSLDEVKGNVENLRKLHELGGANGLSHAVADPALAAIDVQCESILKLEIAKKRGEQK